MRKSQQGYVPVRGHLTDTVSGMNEFFREEMPEFDIHEYDEILDSSDMSPADWETIAKDIMDHYDDYDGFVVLHGTDTMAYTASALSFMFSGLTKPIIITGSQIPIAELRSDGQTNLLNALYIAANYPIAEVCLFFNNKLFRGNRSTKADADGFNAFASPNYPALLEAGIQIKFNPDANPLPVEQNTLTLHSLKPQPIGVVSLYPGISVAVVENILKQPVNALILLTYGVGNAPQNDKLLTLMREATDRGVIIMNLTQCFNGSVNMSGYATGTALANAGVISGTDMTIEACLAKLHFLLSSTLSQEEIRGALQRSLRGEMTTQ